MSQFNFWVNKRNISPVKGMEENTMKYTKVFGDYMENCRDTTVSSDGTICVAFYDASDLLSYNAYGSKTYTTWDAYESDVPEGERDLTFVEYKEVCSVRPEILSGCVNMLVVHGGLFHLDDLAVAALCQIANPNAVIVRLNKPDLTVSGPDEGVLIADVGGTYDPKRWLFDHHQDRYDPETVDKTTVRAAVGRVWDTLGNPEAYPTLTSWIRAVDLHDTGVQWSPLGVFGAFAPNWNETDKTMDDGFKEALEIVKSLILKMIEKDEAAAAAESALDQVPVETNGILYLEKFIPWQGWTANHPEIRAVVTPGRNTGEWNVNLPKGRGKFPAGWLEPANKPVAVTFVANWLTMICVNDREVITDLVSQIEI